MRNLKRLLKFIDKWFEFNNAQTLALAQISLEIGVIFLASWTIVPAFSNYFQGPRAFLGIFLSIVFWFVTIMINKTIQEK